MADEIEARSKHIKSYTNDISFFSFISKKNRAQHWSQFQKKSAKNLDVNQVSPMIINFHQAGGREKEARLSPPSAYFLNKEEEKEEVVREYEQESDAQSDALPVPTHAHVHIHQSRHSGLKESRDRGKASKSSVKNMEAETVWARRAYAEEREGGEEETDDESGDQSFTSDSGVSIIPPQLSLVCNIHCAYKHVRLCTLHMQCNGCECDILLTCCIYRALSSMYKN